MGADWSGESQYPIPPPCSRELAWSLAPSEEEAVTVVRRSSHHASEQLLCSAVSGGPDCAIIVITKRNHASLPFCPAGHCSLTVY